MKTELKEALKAHPENPFLQGHVGALESIEPSAAPACSASSDTPETDAVDAKTRCNDVHSAYFMMRSHAWKMERERTHWKNVAENAQQDHAQADTDSIRALHERNELWDVLARLLYAVTLRMSADEPTPGERMELLRAWEAAGKLIPQNAQVLPLAAKGKDHE